MFKIIAQRSGRHKAQRDAQLNIQELVDRGYDHKKIQENAEVFMDEYIIEYSKQFKESFLVLVNEGIEKT